MQTLGNTITVAIEPHAPLNTVIWADRLSASETINLGDPMTYTVSLGKIIQPLPVLPSKSLVHDMTPSLYSLLSLKLSQTLSLLNSVQARSYHLWVQDALLPRITAKALRAGLRSAGQKFASSFGTSTVGTATFELRWGRFSYLPLTGRLS